MGGRPVVFNGLLFCMGRRVGIHRFATEILKRIGKRLPGRSLILLVPEGADPRIGFPGVRTVHYGRWRDTRLGCQWWLQRELTGYVRKSRSLGIDLMVGLPHSDFELISILDCIREDYPPNDIGLTGKMKRQLYVRRVQRALAAPGVKVITLSEDAKASIVAHYGFDATRIEIVPCGWEHMADIAEDEAILDQLHLRGQEYYFSLGTHYEHKNHRWMLEAAQLNPELLFVVTGNGQVGDAFALRNVLHTGYLSDGEMKALMAHAKALIEPSLAEGFGVPPLEAISLGTPAIVSTASCLPEIYGPYAYYLDPYDFAFDFSQVRTVPLPDPAPLLGRYSWENAARRLAELIEDAG